MQHQEETKANTLLSVNEAAAFLGVTPATIRRWIREKKLRGVKRNRKSGSAWRFKRDDVLKLSIATESHFGPIKKFILENAKRIHDHSTDLHIEHVGDDNLRAAVLRKNVPRHVVLVHEFAHWIDDLDGGTKRFAEIGTELAEQAIAEGLTLEETADGILFLKQSFWEALKENGLLFTLSANDLYEFNYRIGMFIDTVLSRIVFGYHHSHGERERLHNVRFSAVLEALSSGVILLDMEGKVVMANSAMHRLLQGTVSTPLQGTTLSALHNMIEVQTLDREPVDDDRLPTTEVLRGRSVSENELHIRLKRSQSTRYFSVSAEPIIDVATGRQTYGVVIFWDITKRVHTERALRENEARFIRYTDAMPQLAFVADAKGNIVYFNKGWRRYVGEMVKLKGWAWVRTLVHPDERDETVTEVRHSLETGEAFEREFRLRRHDGTYRWHLCRAVPLRDEHGKIVQWLGTNTDIEEQKRAAEVRDEFIGIASHELRTPITSVKAYTQVMRHRFSQRGDKESVAIVEKMNLQLERLTSLVGDMFDVTKIESGKLRFHMEPFELDELVREVVSDMRLTTSQHKIMTHITSDVIVRGDRNRIGQVLNNLLSNAIKYSPNATSIEVVMKVHRGMRNAADRVSVSVRDYGVGMTPSERKRLFERFYRVEGKESGTFPGLGLGLYISHEIITRHGGRIRVVSVKGKGTTFSFELPLYQD